MSTMEQRSNFLALTLLDALEDGNEADIFAMLERNTNIIDAAIVPCERGIAPLHYVCGMQNEQLALRILSHLLKNPKLDLNVRCDGNMTALHIAAIYGRVELVRLLLKHGARVDLADDEHKLPVHYAIEECHFEILQLMRDHIFLEKCSRDKRARVEVQKTSTPKCGIKYNYDATSPYYINITHRRGKPQPKFPDETPAFEHEPEEKSLNLFSLTREHLAELTQSQTEPSKQSTSRTLIESWREKVESSRARQSLLEQYEHVEAMVEQALVDDDFSCEQHLRKARTEAAEAETAAAADKELLELTRSNKSGCAAFGQLVEQVVQAPPLNSNDVSFYTALPEPEQETSPNERTGLIRSPRRDEYFLQMTEAYVHTDDENGLVFYETKLVQNGGNKAAAAAMATTNEQPLNSTVSSQSTNLTLPLDYETDALRAELTQFGAPVGPITRTTKRLYIKQLIKYKRNTEQMLKSQQHAQSTQIKYSVELHRTLRSSEDFGRISEYLQHESASAAHFANSSPRARTMREGHLKQSFIYMLIDPRISRNLPGESTFLDKFDVWQRFLDSVFYVGKGKSSRPYAHLYDAMRQHTRAHQQQQQTAQGKRAVSIRKEKCLLQADTFKSPPPANAPASSKKLQRILEIWRNGCGVVCLHVFHNIMPTDAYTREAAMIEALGLTHLTNLKRGDYYGPAQSWTMKQKKQLGIALLFKAMHIYLAEGESQLSPSDLI